jgi:phage terminase large subunit-like protein
MRPREWRAAMTTDITPVCGPARPDPPRDRSFNLALASAHVNGFITQCFTDSKGEPVKQAEIHEQLQAFLTANKKALIEFPRDHGKSFQVCCRVLWELGKRDGLRVKIVCATGAVAAERSRFLCDHIVHNNLIRRVFPKLRAAKPWGAKAFTIRRDAHTIGPSVAAFGVGAGSTGTRADLLICDDIVDVRSIRSCHERERVADYFTNNLMNLLEPDGTFWGLFTPWHSDDLNARLKKNTTAYSLLSRPINANFESIWPEKWPTERLLARKEEIGSASFARGYRLVPIADDETLIRVPWVRYWSEDEPANYETVLLSVDPAVSASAKADRSALVVLARTAGSPQVRVLACTARRLAAPELVNLINDFDQLWKPGVILFETNAAFLGIKDLLTRHARFGPKLKSVTQSADKASRVSSFSVVVENGAFRLKGEGGVVDVGQRELFDEMTTFPFGEHDDLIDAAATGTAYLLNYRDPRVWG